MTPTLRSPLPADYEVIADWIPDAAACLRWAGPNVLFPFAASSLAGQLDVVNGRGFVLAEGPDAPLAFGQYWVVREGAAHLGRIIVSPSRRGSGLGRMLCERLMHHAVQNAGANEITLRVYTDNAPALHLYSRLGFVPTPSDSTASVLSMRAPAGPRIDQRV